MNDILLLLIALVLSGLPMAHCLVPHFIQTNRASICKKHYSLLSSALRVSSMSSSSSSSPPLGTCRIKVIGVGGGGSNAVNRMMLTERSQALVGSGVDEHGLSHLAGLGTAVEYWVVNTDQQALAKSPVPNKLSIGPTSCR